MLLQNKKKSFSNIHYIFLYYLFSNYPVSIYLVNIALNPCWNHMWPIFNICLYLSICLSIYKVSLISVCGKILFFLAVYFSSPRVPTVELAVGNNKPNLNLNLTVTDTHATHKHLPSLGVSCPIINVDRGLNGMGLKWIDIAPKISISIFVYLVSYLSNVDLTKQKLFLASMLWFWN